MSEMNPEVRRIHELIGDLSDCCWRTMSQRQAEPGFSALDYLFKHYEGECRPRTEEEIAIWAELTSPHNYDALVSYVNYWRPVGVNEYAARLHATLLAEAGNRRQHEAAGET